MIWHTLKSQILGGGYYIQLGVAILIATIFMWIGAHLVRVLRPHFFRALLAAIVGTGLAWLIRFLMAMVMPLAGDVFGFLLGFLIVLLVVKAFFDTSLGQALIVWLCFLLSQLAITMLYGPGFFGDLSAFFKNGFPR